jgi:glycosyltransferase involved in cell wall biosynthesis
MIVQFLKMGFKYLQRHQFHRKPFFRIVWLLLPERLKNKIRSTNLGQVNLSPLPDKKLTFNGKIYLHNKSADFQRGVNIIGFAKGDFGLAEHCRLTTHAFKVANVNFGVIDIDNTLHSKTNQALEKLIIAKPQFQVNLLSFNADSLMHYVGEKQDAYYDKRYNISYGYWETSEYPKLWTMQNNVVNEIWAPSRYVQEVIAEKATVPVIYMPIAVDFEIPTEITRRDFNLPEDKFLFLFTFDISSTITRKNPMAVINAYVKAFDKQTDNVVLVIKINRVISDLAQQAKAEHLKTYAKELALPIIFIDEVLSRRRILGLIYCCDCYVSLHRSEGFGLGMAEAMKMGKVVIGTNYSGNTDFMNQQNACLVDYGLVPIQKKDYFFVEEGAVWAEPDIEHAAYYMHKLVNDLAYTKRLGLRAKQDMDEKHNFSVIGARYRKRLELLDLI